MDGPTVNLQHHPEKTLECSDCSKPLMHYWQYTNDCGNAQSIKATCPFCQGSSFTKEIDGFFYIGPISHTESSNPTVIDEIHDLGKINNRHAWMYNILKR